MVFKKANVYSFAEIYLFDAAYNKESLGLAIIFFLLLLLLRYKQKKMTYD